MKNSKWISLLLIVAFSTNISAQKLKTEKDSISYSLGVLIAKSIKENNELEYDNKIIIKAIEDALADEEMLIQEAEAEVYYMASITKIKNKESMGIKDAGAKFLAENKDKEGVITLPSGLQYKVITEGEGESPKPTDNVTTHYKGYSIDGKVFDSSYERNQPATFPVNGVISGWTEALQLMKPGSKWQLFIPYNLAYGERGAGADIKPFEALIFDVELIKVN